MLFLSQIFVFIFVFFIILLNIRSLANEGDFITDVSSFSDEDPTHDLSFLYRSSKITIKQQLKSRLPNINEPLRDLKLGKLNFLHTTDTHGWYLGHLNQKQYSSDWGDFISLHANLLSDLNNQGSDLLLVDTGDRHDGNGLSDLTYPNGELSSKIFMMMDYDLITVGNHELYREEISQYEYENLVPRYGESFISTNVQYLNDNDEWVVFGNNTHRYFETKVNKYKILSFSFMFDFKMGNRRVNVVPIAEILEQSWFLELVDDYASNYEVDALVIFGHIPVAHDWIELSQLHNFFRSRFPSTYIQYFGGHSHIRDFSVLDDLSTALQSGRYCETVGFLSIDDFPKEGKNESYLQNNIHRKYIDFNLHSFMHHSNRTILDKFNTEKGLFVSNELARYSKTLLLDEVYGNVPHSYYISAADYTNRDEKSLLRFLEDEILVQLEPKSCNNKIDKLPTLPKSNDRIILINTGGIRYDLYKGEFTRNSLFTVSPFQNMWRVLPSVPTNVALKLKGILNNRDYIISSNPQDNLKSPFQYAIEKKHNLMNPYKDITTSPNTNNANVNINANNLNLNSNSNANNDNHNSKDNEVFFVSNKQNNYNSNFKGDRRLPLSYGYTTTDDIGIHGDDTIHRKLPSFYVPNVIQSHETASNDSTSEFTNVVYYDFIEPFVFDALKEACDGDETLLERLLVSAQYYNDCPTEYNLGQMLKNYAFENWN